MNVKLTSDEFWELTKESRFTGISCDIPEDMPIVVSLFGKRVHYLSDGVLIYDRCEFCGAIACRCGAPLDWQGKRPQEITLTAVAQMLST